MIFGYSTNAFVKYSLLESLEKIAGLGFKGVEIMGDRPHLYPPDFKDIDMARVKETLETHRLNVTNLNSFTLFAVGDTYLPSWIEPDADIPPAHSGLPENGQRTGMQKHFRSPGWPAGRHVEGCRLVPVSSGSGTGDPPGRGAGG